MTTISQTAPSAQARSAPKAKARNASLDRSRTFITMLVLIHHSVIAYTYFGHTDPQSFLGFDGVVTFNDQAPLARIRKAITAPRGKSGSGRYFQPPQNRPG